MKKPREFWLELNDELTDDVVYKIPVDNMLHVIEYEAFDRAMVALKFIRTCHLAGTVRADLDRMLAGLC